MNPQFILSSNSKRIGLAAFLQLLIVAFLNIIQEMTVISVRISKVSQFGAKSKIFGGPTKVYAIGNV